QPVFPPLERETPLADAPAPRDHRIAAPGDRRLGPVLAVADQLLDAVAADLRDPSPGPGRDVDLQRAVADGDQRARRERGGRPGPFAAGGIIHHTGAAS